jgi:pSer/pThr/pTyr-binding forkhead associated (FHA) protein/two-component sensor histidine kinase
VRYRLVSGEGRDRATFTVGEADSVTIGRSAENDLVVPNKLVSGVHAEVVLTPDGPLIRDVGSKNGTWVNGDRIDGVRGLVHGDRVVIGGQALSFLAEPDLARTSVMFREDAPETTQIHAAIDSRAPLNLRDKSLETARRNLAILNETGSLLLLARDEEDLSSRILDLVFDLLDAERGCVVLTTPSGEPETMAARSLEGVTERLEVSKTILGRTLEEGLSLLTSDAAEDERLKAGHSIVLQGIRAAMCAPIRGKRAVLGAIYVDTRMQKGAFSPQDLELLTTLGIHAGITIENQRLLRENVQAERLAAIGGVVAGLSHDIRNILTSLKGGAYMLDSILKDHENQDLRGAWEIVGATTDTIAELVDDMVSYSKDRQPDKSVIDVNDHVKTVLKRFRNRAAERGGTLVDDLDEKTGFASLDRNGIDRVLTNLVSNALDAVADREGVVTVRTKDLGESVEITVEDNGPGVPEADQGRIFDLLFSTKGSRGTGFGLAITKKIVEEHGGEVRLDPEGEKGARFRIVLPRS